ncbi:MAG: hypothetical protein ACOX0U_04090 [Oscillospiraceae bacterium]
MDAMQIIDEQTEIIQKQNELINSIASRLLQHEAITQEELRGTEVNNIDAIRRDDNSGHDGSTKCGHGVMLLDNPKKYNEARRQER